MSILPSISSIFITALIVGGSLQPFSRAVAAEPPVSFEREVKFILQFACVECHQPGGDGYEASGLDLRTYDGLMKGTKYGPIVVPGDAFVSNLMVLIEGRASPSISMPFHREPLRQGYINIIRHWIDEGAKHN